MDFEFSDEQETLRASVRRFLDERAPLAATRSFYANPAGARAAAWSGLADLGVVGLLAPEQHGGAGRGMVDAAVVLEELGRVVSPLPFASSAIGTIGLVTDVGSDADHTALLPTLVDGSAVGTVALLESGRRAAWRSPTTRAARVGAPTDGATTLDGTKVFVADAAVADVLLVSATDDAGTLGVYAVEAGTEGVHIAATATVDGSRGLGEVTLTGARATRLGAGDAGDAVGATADRLATAAVVEGVGTASRALELSIEYATQRRQFGSPIGAFQAVQHLCADMLRAVELARAAGYYACWTADDGDPVERHRAATMALAFAADELYAVGASAIQVHGGIGYTWEHDVHLFYKRLLTLQSTGGGATDQLEELARITLD